MSFWDGELVGWLGGSITVGSILAQTVRAVRTRSTGDLSWLWIVLFVAGSAFWWFNGWITANRPLWAANAAMLVLMGITSVVKLRNPVARGIKRMSRADASNLRAYARKRGITTHEAAEAAMVAGLRTLTA